MNDRNTGKSSHGTQLETRTLDGVARVWALYLEYAVWDQLKGMNWIGTAVIQWQVIVRQIGRIIGQTK